VLSAERASSLATPLHRGARLLYVAVDWPEAHGRDAHSAGVHLDHAMNASVLIEDILIQTPETHGETTVVNENDVGRKAEPLVGQLDIRATRHVVRRHMDAIRGLQLAEHCSVKNAT
jgi:hypothetical protein